MDDVKFGKRSLFRVVCFFLLVKIRKYEGLSHCAYFRHYGKRGTRDLLKAKKCLIM